MIIEMFLKSKRMKERLISISQFSKKVATMATKPGI